MGITADWIGCNNYNSGGPQKVGVTLHHQYGYGDNLRSVFENNGVSAHFNSCNGHTTQYVSLVDRAWHGGVEHDGSYWANTYMIGIEQANSSVAYPYPISDKTIEGTTKLCVEIAQVMGWKSYTRKQSEASATVGLLQGHRERAATACPGDYFFARLDSVCADINKRLGGNMGKAGDIIQWSPNFKGNQKWIISEEDKQGYCHITDVAKGRCLDVYGSKAEANAAIIAWPRKEPATANQLWRIEEHANGSWTLHSALDDELVLDIFGKSRSAGAAAILWQYTGAPNQCFIPVDTGEGSYYLLAAHSLLPLDVFGG
ncbi:MAG: RICIN domain-containing protein [Coriobacteriales bacterium]|jgi:hypothetical protein|nr:RICIN domain-containing protein [Coriobacteriales bacterium]